jgi:leader peptidase (prepilin peptidase)/N-methyltransferase
MWMKSQGALREGRFVPFGPFLAGAGFMVAVLGVERFRGWVGL